MDRIKGVDGINGMDRIKRMDRINGMDRIKRMDRMAALRAAENGIPGRRPVPILSIL